MLKGLPHIQINAADPGSTNTDLVGDFSNNSKPASEGVKPIIKLATIDKMVLQEHLLMVMAQCRGKSLTSLASCLTGKIFNEINENYTYIISY